MFLLADVTEDIIILTFWNRHLYCHSLCLELLMLRDFLVAGSVSSITPLTALLLPIRLLHSIFSQYELWPIVASEDCPTQYSQCCSQIPDNSTTEFCTESAISLITSHIQRSYKSSQNLPITKSHSPPYNLITKKERTRTRR